MPGDIYLEFVILGNSVKATAIGTAKLLGCKADEIHVASTGVIGVKLSVDKLVATLPQLAGSLSGAAWDKGAAAIMTTDTTPKAASRTVVIGGQQVRITVIAKGSGMIAPDMATMLAFIFTDAKVPGSVLQKLLTDAADKSLNCVTVDGDTSTSDTLLLAATGSARHAPIEEADDPVLVDFKRALDELLIDLAQLLARDGEGATKFITINVGGASSNGAARKIGLAVANSPLVKTAIAGEDANWGRIVMAVGKAGVWLEQRPAKGIWGGLWSLPEFADEATAATGHGFGEASVAEARSWPVVDHAFTHFDLELVPWVLPVPMGAARILQDGWRIEYLAWQAGHPSRINLQRAADALHEAHGIPVEIVVDEARGVLKVEPLGEHIGGDDSTVSIDVSRQNRIVQGA